MRRDGWSPDDLARLIDDLVQDAGLSQSELARLVGVKQAQISRWKSGSRPKYENILTLARVVESTFPELEITPRQLLAAAGYYDYEPEPPDHEPPTHELRYPDDPGLQAMWETAQRYYPDAADAMMEAADGVLRALRRGRQRHQGAHHPRAG